MALLGIYSKKDVPDQFTTQRQCNEEVNQDRTYAFQYVPDRFKTQEMCDRAVKQDPFMTQVHSRSIKNAGNV